VVENVDSDGGNDGEVCIGFGDCGEEGVATVRVESLVIIVDTNAVTSCGDRRGGSDCMGGGRNELDGCGAVSIGVGEGADCEVGDDGGVERGICGARVDGAGVYIVAGVYVGRGGDASRGFGA
jgi:hypothetical protein